MCTYICKRNTHSQYMIKNGTHITTTTATAATSIPTRELGGHYKKKL